MNLMDTLSGSLLEGFFPAGWDLAKMDACIGTPETVLERQNAMRFSPFPAIRSPILTFTWGMRSPCRFV